MNFKISKRYKDIFDLYVHKGEPTPFSIGTIVVFAFCFLILVVATFSQFEFTHPWFSYTTSGFGFKFKTISYMPQIPAMLFVIYILGKNYSILFFITYLLTGLFVWPFFAFGGGLGYAQNYLFGYFIGFLVAIFITGTLLKKSMDIKMRLLSALCGVVAIHTTGALYCFFLALFKIIDFGLIIPVVSALSGTRIAYDIIFSLVLYSVAPYIKNVFWICMKPKADNPKKSRRFRHTKQNS